MLKKIILWTLYAAFVGILIFGAINRTTVKTGDDDGLQAGNAAEREAAGNLESGGNGNAYGQGEAGSPQLDESAEQEDAAAPGLDEPAGHVDGKVESHDTAKHEWVTLTGTISSIIPRGMTMATTTGQPVEVARRAWRFAQEQGFAPQVGDQVTLDGFYEDGKFEVAVITDLTNGQTVYLRDDAGHPLWSAESGNGNK